MALEPKLSHMATMILQAIHACRICSFGVMEVTGLPSGTVYPAMRRLERDGSFRHTLFFYAIRLATEMTDPTPSIPKVQSVSLIGLEPLD
jgi:hypothetical protein